MQNLITQLYNPLLGYVKKQVRSHEDAQDLTQDVFYKLSKSNSDGVENLKSWVYTIAKNTITDYYRKKRILTEEIDNSTLSPSDNNDPDAAQELGKCVHSFINQLPEEYKELMILSEIKEMSQKEIAELLDVNYITVRSKIQRGRKKLKNLFTDCCTIIQGGKGSIMSYEKNECNMNKKDQKC
ncbi:sigma-70 family RNA polymerase sigma factor [Aquimarina sediminis]|uniref:sigma-70 family RNA polymerase sigma factor n=1 Tax=Aquimarina sediminis TaxID=2070536 RepID=UPI000CA01E17|nr:sigma-70 family RNA polymerase sigma factor [Aquimarina sediminis]